jgi:predicted RNase H-like HicB family nuclease
MTLERPKRKRICPTCGAEMQWLPLINRFFQLYRWRASCPEHGFAKRQPKT